MLNLINEGKLDEAEEERKKLLEFSELLEIEKGWKYMRNLGITDLMTIKRGYKHVKDGEFKFKKAHRFYKQAFDQTPVSIITNDILDISWRRTGLIAEAFININTAI